MKTRIATSLGIAFVLVFGIVAVFAALGPQEAQADPINNAADDNTNPEGRGNRVTGVQVEAVPNAPNAQAKWTVQFMNGSIDYHNHVDADDNGMIDDATETDNVAGQNTYQEDNRLDGGTGDDVIMIEFEDDVQFPTAISPSEITITTNKVWDSRNTGDARIVDRTVVANPLGVNIIKVSQFKGTEQLTDRPPDETLVSLEIPDMDESDAAEGSQGIAPGATVTVVFRQTAGIKNPTESKANEVTQENRDAAVDDDGNFDASELKMLSGYMVQVATSNNGNFVSASGKAVIARRLTLSDQDGPRGSTITVVGLGFRNSITATIWNDKNENGMRDSGEIELGSALVTGSDDFTTTITINNPPFTSNLDTNGVNAVDGRDRTIIPGRQYRGAISNVIFTESIPKYILESSIRVSPGTAAIGDRVQVTARDFVRGGSIGNAVISIGGVSVSDHERPSVSPTGDASFEMTIPNNVASGTQSLVIKNPGSAKTIVNTGGARFSMVISGAQITVTPSENLVPNQTVTLVGRGFSTGGEALVNARDPDIDSRRPERDSDSEATISGDGEFLTPRSIKLNDGDEIDVDNAGNWSSSFVIPITSTTTTPGDHELSITDTLGRGGSAILNIAERELTLTPASGRVGTRVDVRGTGFPSDNPGEGGESTPTVKVQYSIAGDTRTVSTLSPDGSGVIRGWFTVPLDAGIPSTNAVRAEFEIDDVPVTTNAVHQVPRAGITLDQESGPAGSIVKITGQGFKRYATVSEILFGTLDVRSGFGLSTDGVGGFESTFLVPGANTGAQAVTVKVAETTASATFTVSADAVVAPTTPAAAPMPPADALAAVIANDNNLVRVWQFDASMQNEAPDFGWSLYDPRPLFADANTIEMVESGKFYWINVQNEQTAVLGGVSRTLYAGWNPVTW